MKNFLQTIEKHDLVRKGDKVLVGVSGGPDSLALLIEFATLRQKLGITLYICHIDHGLRKDSSQDALFVQSWAKKLNIPLFVKKLNPKILEKKGSLEELLRQERFDFLIKTAKKIKANKIALGHNLDDQAETVLMRILRGTGLHGLSGILPKRQFQGIVFIRPLLETSRRQIEAFLKRKQIKARIDSTNKEDIFFRNKIRNRLIPLLKKEYNKNIIEGLANLANSAACDYDYLSQVACKIHGLKTLSLRLNKINKLHAAILRIMIRQLLMKLQGSMRRISFKHIREIEDMINRRPISSIVDLPKGISVQKTRNFLRFYRR